MPWLADTAGFKPQETFVASLILRQVSERSSHFTLRLTANYSVLCGAPHYRSSFSRSQPAI